MRLIDYLINKKSALPAAYGNDKELFTRTILESEVIVADNVAKYYFEQNTKTIFYADDFPIISPPLDNMFIEWRAPSYINVGGEITYHPTIKPSNTIYGVHVMSYKDDDDGKEYVRSLFVPYLVQDEEQMHFAFAYLIDIYGTGKPMHQPDTGGWIRIMFISEDNTKQIDNARNIVSGALFPALMTISFMHCKNVKIKTVIPSSSLSKKHQKRYGNPYFKYKVLEIEPMKKVLEREGDIQHNGLKMALHICRGHFKNFEEGKGLFGKYHGMYWWNQQVRGNSDVGIVDKDYKVNLDPKQSP